MPLPRSTVSWNMSGGLDTSKSPLQVQPGSFLTLDNVVQERAGEWRRRNGWTQVAADTIPEVAPFFVGRLGDSGLFEDGQAGLSAYSPSLLSGRWSPQAISAPPQHRSRRPIMQTNQSVVAFARAGNVISVGSFSSTLGSTASAFDVASGAQLSSAAMPNASLLAYRGAATATKLVIFYVDTAGNLRAIVTDAATGATAAAVTIKAGMFAGFPELDAMWYGGSTITVVCATASIGISFIEFNPDTLALVTDTVVAGVSCSNTLALLPDPDASGVRFVASSDALSTPTTRVTRCNSVGGILSDDQVEAISSSDITGVASVGGANWNVIYQTTSNLIRTNNKTGGAIGVPANLQGSSTWGTSGRLDSQAWRDPNVNGWSVLIGLHSQDTSDPQDTYVEMFLPLGASVANAIPVSTPVQLAAAVKHPVGCALCQVVRTAPYKFSMALPVEVIYENNAGVIVRHYSIDLFEQTFLTSADDAVTPTGRPVQYKQTSFVPAGQLSFYDGGTLKPLGTRTPPRILTGTPSTAAGALLPAVQYQGVAVVEQIDSDGNVWRSPESAPALVTMGATDNTITWKFSSWGLEPGTFYRLGLYRTAGGGSSFKRIFSTLFVAGADITYVDLLADATIVNGEVLYTQGELETALTPPASLVWLQGDRLWYVNREYPTEFGYSKNLRPGRLPEFTNEGILDQDDGFGDITGGAGLLEQTVIFKKNAIYFVTGDGLTDSGSGTQKVVTQIDSDKGAIAGSPIVPAGDVVYYVSERGIEQINRSGEPSWIGEPVDQFLNQPLVQAKETVFDGCFVPLANEVRFLTTNYVLVHNRTFQTWTRWTMAGFRRCLVINGKMVMFRNDGTVWREGDQTQTTDAGTAFTGVIRSPWMRPSAGLLGPASGNTSTTSQQRIRLYEGRIIYTRTAGGDYQQLIGQIYENNDDAQVESFSSDGIPGTTLSGVGEMKPLNQKCTSFSLGLVLPSGDDTIRVDGFAAVIGLDNGALAVEAGNRWK